MRQKISAKATANVDQSPPWADEAAGGAKKPVAPNPRPWDRRIDQHIAEGVEGGTVSSRMSCHLRHHLELAKLVVSRRDGRQILHSTKDAILSKLIALLMRDCGQDLPEICAPATEWAACCANGQSSATAS